jgi:hypothetical protein
VLKCPKALEKAQQGGLRVRVRLSTMLVAAGLAFAGPAFAAPEAYQIFLGPAARTNATQMLALGRGLAEATLDGNKLSISGNFGGLPSAATDAHLCQGIGIGVPGTCDTDLTVSKDMTGSLSGAITLNAKQLAALRAGQLYVQINSQKAPAPGGNLWGWILIVHKTVEQDVPQQGDWFLPQYDMPLSAEHGGTHPLLTKPAS